MRQETTFLHNSLTYVSSYLPEGYSQLLKVPLLSDLPVASVSVLTHHVVVELRSGNYAKVLSDSTGSFDAVKYGLGQSGTATPIPNKKYEKMLTNHDFEPAIHVQYISCWSMPELSVITSTTNNVLAAQLSNDSELQLGHRVTESLFQWVAYVHVAGTHNGIFSLF